MRRLISFFGTLLIIFLLTSPVQAVVLKGLEKTAEGIGYTAQPIQGGQLITARLFGKIGTYINTATALLGMVFMVLIWIGAFDIVGAGGNEATVKKGRDRIKNGAIGLFIILIAYFITRLILYIIGGTGYFITN